MAREYNHRDWSARLPEHHRREAQAQVAQSPR
jgi:hypothetical protein